ncbi:T-cell immunoglobulin and mucin domain-containing protein 4-like isoform X1 [Pezoporus wallicus]|uniref:T-cell immunoglobulin and mucin domain-containing protein 4-like isoform X1 n=1 Tax=Pezoporus wallicus TaxID=35540 RepID=UPI00254A45DB|nr:T-cell immunoglobulin and mucin domain-containing protein 4-like isoform X1 [Pezoporus wallicus]
MSHFVLFRWIMIQSFIVHATSEAVIRGVVGQSVKLPCFYKVARHKDISDMCWGRGPCPNSKCKNKVLHTTRNRVTYRISQRYSLRGYISYGDVSLTIANVRSEDAGTYCCRVEIPGWFNDIKQNIQLEVDRAPPVITTTTRRAPVSPTVFRETTSALPATSHDQTTAETPVLLTTTVPEATTATTSFPAVTTPEPIAPLTFAVTATMVTTSALPDFSTRFEAVDVTAEYDCVFCSEESVALTDSMNVTTEFPSTLLTAEGTKSTNTSLMEEGVPTAGISSSFEGTAEKHDDNGDKFPIYVFLIACLVVVPVLFILVLSLLLRKRLCHQEETRDHELVGMQQEEDCAKNLFTHLLQVNTQRSL